MRSWNCCCLWALFRSRPSHICNRTCVHGRSCAEEPKVAIWTRNPGIAFLLMCTEHLRSQESRGAIAAAGRCNCGTKTERIQLWAVTKPNMTSSRPNDAVLKAKAAQHSKAEGDLTTTNANEVGAALAVLQAQFELNSIDLTWNSTNLTWKLPLCPKSKLGWYGLSKPGLCDVKCQPRPCCICM